ncbi:ImmA/IrrE family metallo-endopeptidase [Arthrobacter sp. STN4]|uniref:ImmA/IrrE family metallo-endopeptidase n=1 Tax=Arthrobacter sp. STN4 TaxID=2923276 RepID=UPI00211A4C28|nr:ImmA/IrrE family metallo-endopeptidase [Arthrobacter sp. STN4]MCQ9163110.1 ImmA/IrrE family metallo-endopeptidase [Arthrobacter sp. STN4]
MGFRRGFKTEANNTALETRQELQLGPFDPLDPLVLAGYLEIPVLTLSDLAQDHSAIGYLLDGGSEVFSAATVFYGTERTIVHNDAHSPGRQNSNLAHELAHGLLLHPPTPALDDRGCREWNQSIEDEAGWLAGALLVPEAAAIAIARGKWTRDEAAAHFGVSNQMIQYRLNATGALLRVARARASRR